MNPFALAPLVLGVLCAAASSSAATAGDVYRDRVAPFLQTHCFDCHAGDDAEKHLRLDLLADESAARAARATWEKVRGKLTSGEMPPKKKPRPPATEVQAVIGWIDATFARTADGSLDPGRVTLRRLNRFEYENTIRDFLGVEFSAEAEFPSDDVGYGFDDIGDVLSMSDIHAEKYLRAAERLAAQAVIVEDTEHPPVRHFAAADVIGEFGSALRDGKREMFAQCDAYVQVVLPRDGDYLLRARACGDQAGPEPVRMAFKVDNRELTRVDVRAVRGASEVYEARTHISGGKRKIIASFVNDYYKPDDPDPKSRDRNMSLEWIEVVGPVDAPRLSSFQKRWLADSKADRRAVIAEVAKRAWRRPATHGEVERLVALSPKEASLAECVQIALTGLLASPSFLFRVEPDPDPSSQHPVREPPGGDVSVRNLNDWELASRLSYFIWSSLPDDDLFALAEKGSLHESAVVVSQVQRMLRDARSSALALGFAPQWLQTRNLDRVAPDPARFPAFDEDLRTSMKAESQMFFDAILRENRPVRELLEADFTFLDEKLARHYGIPGVHGPEMRRVHLEKSVRGGLLGQGAVLTVTSNPTRTSPVKRGKWILDVLLGAPPPPPPPGVGVLDESRAAETAASFRERLAAHRTKSECAVCHDRLDPLGIGLESFDATGAWRERDGEFAIDSSGTTPDGRAFRGPEELRALLLSDRAFVRALAKKLATYARGRGLTAFDEPAIDELMAALPSREPTLQELILGVVRLDAFQKRRREDGD